MQHIGNINKHWKTIYDPCNGEIQPLSDEITDRHDLVSCTIESGSLLSLKWLYAVILYLFAFLMY